MKLRNVKEIIQEDKLGLLPQDNSHWLYNERQIASILINNPDVVNILEIGSFTGAGSTILWGNSVKERGGVVYCNDLFELSQSPEEIDMFRRFGFKFPLSKLWEQFLSNMQVASLDEVIIPLKMSSDDFFKDLLSASWFTKLPTIDLCYIDGNHDYNYVYRDIENCIQCFPKAIICGDDFKFEPWASQIKPAVKELAEKYELRFTGDENFWMLHTRPFIYK